MQVTTSNAIMQVLRLYCNYADNIFCYIVMWFGLSVANKHVAVSVVIMQLDVSAELMEVTVSGLNVGVTIFIVFMQVGVSVAIMQVLLSAMHNCFYCKMQVTVSIIAMQMTLSSNNFMCLSLTGTHFSKS